MYQTQDQQIMIIECKLKLYKNVDMTIEDIISN